MIGVGTGIGVSRLRGLERAVQALFGAGENGVLYDLSDFSALFQDSSGTTAAVISQPSGLVRDKSGNDNSATSTTTERPTLGTTARLVSNIFGGNTNNNIAWNANISPAPTNNVPLVDAPEGITYGFQIAEGATGFIQTNTTITANTEWYEESFIVYVTAPGAVFRTSSLGIVGGGNTGVGVTYDFDSEVSSVNTLQVVDLGGGYYRLSILFQNNSGTTWVHRLDSGAGMEKLVFSGQQLVMAPADIVRKRMLGYASKGVLSDPWYGFGADGVRYISNTSQPYTHINAWGDSFVGSGSLHTWQKEFSRLYGEFYKNGVGGETSTEIKTRMLASATTATDICIIECGRNNPVKATVLADIAEMVASIPHDKYVICAICNRNDSADEALGGSAYDTILDINSTLAATYPDNYVDIRAALIGAYDPADPDEVAAFAMGITTSRLQGDGLHPTDAGQIAITTAIWDFMEANNMVSLVDQRAYYHLDLDGADDSMTVAAGGGGDAGFFLCTAVRVDGGAGTNRVIYSDAGTNTGYIARINTSNQLELAASNGAPIATPVQAAATTSTTGGTGLAASTAYYYVVTALNALGETLKSNEQTVTTGLGTTNSNTISWGAVTGATGYRVYRGTEAGAENVYYTVGAVTSYVDTGAASTAGSPPAYGSTAYVKAATTDTLTAGPYVVTAWDDGTNLNVQVNSGTVGTAARPAVSAGNADFRIGKDYGAATGFFNGAPIVGAMVYVTNGQNVDATDRANAKAYIASKAGLTL